jgi:hypothetical protein
MKSIEHCLILSSIGGAMTTPEDGVAFPRRQGDNRRHCAHHERRQPDGGAGKNT